MDGQGWIEKLALQPHPEGGFYRLTFTAELKIASEALPEGFTGARPVATAIYFLLTKEGGDPQGHFSAFHRLRSDEMWHFYAGSPLAVHVIAPDGGYSQLLLGAGEDEQFQAVVRAGCWFASELLLENSFALVGCTVSPGFDFADFELARRDELASVFSQHADLIRRLTRG